MSAEAELRSEMTDFINELSKKYGDDFTIGTVLIATDVLNKNDDSFTYTIEHESSDPRHWVQRALLDQLYEKLEPDDD